MSGGGAALTGDSTPEAEAEAGLGVRVRGFVASVAGLCKGRPRRGGACAGCVALSFEKTTNRKR